jgi:hypothetical protein
MIFVLIKLLMTKPKGGAKYMARKKRLSKTQEKDPYHAIGGQSKVENGHRKADEDGSTVIG